MTAAAPRVLVHRADQARGLLIWVHGGSWRSGSAAAWSPMTAELAERSGWTVLSVDYRIAPEHPYPAAVEDVLTVLDRVTPRRPPSDSHRRWRTSATTASGSPSTTAPPPSPVQHPR